VGVFIEIGGERQHGPGVEMPPAGHGQAHAEEQNAIAAILHTLGQILQGRERDPGLFLDDGVDRMPFNQGPQRPGQLEIAARFYLQKDICDRRARRTAHIDQDHGAVLSAVRDIHPLGGHGIAGEVPGVRLRRVSTPVDDEVCPVLDLAQGGGALAYALKGDTRGAVAY
jgi:hypothetical protein